MKKAILMGCILAMALIFIGCASTKTQTPAQDESAYGMTGTWLLLVHTPMGSGQPEFQLEQEGDELTGTYAGAFGTAPVTGTVTNDSFVIEFTSARTKMIYDGTVDGDTMEGEIDIGGQATGTFTGEKQ